jgi:hypothetical protein
VPRILVGLVKTRTNKNATDSDIKAEIDALCAEIEAGIPCFA